MLVYYKNNLFTQINNYNNFNHFAGLLNMILFNIDRKKEFLDIYFAVIYIAEKTFYKNKENAFNKIYLCSLLSKNKIFSDKKFWEDLIELKMNSIIEQKLPLEVKQKENEYIVYNMKLKQQMELEEKVKQEGEHQIFTNRNSLPNENQSITNNINSDNLLFSKPTHRKVSSGNNSLMNIFGSKVKNFFSNNNSNIDKPKSSNKNVVAAAKNNILLENFKIDHEQILKKLRKNESANIIKEFLTHFCNFNFDICDANDLIVEFAIKYGFEEEKVLLFVSIVNSNMFTIKNKSTRLSQKDSNNSCSKQNLKKYLSLNDNKLSIIASCLKYINVSDYRSLILINKSYNKKISKILYSGVLLNNSDIKSSIYNNKVENQKKIRFGIWNKALKMVTYGFFIYFPLKLL